AHARRVLELLHALLERGHTVVARRPAASAATLLEVRPQALHLALHGLELLLLLLQLRPHLPVALDQVRARGAAREREQSDQTPPCKAYVHCPRITEWTRRLRAQQVSVSSWQSGSSSP